MGKDNMVSKTTGVIIILSSIVVFVGLALIGIYISFNYTDIFSDNEEVVKSEMVETEEPKLEIIYPEEISSILHSLDFLTDVYSSYCSIISINWYNSISNGQDINVGIQEALNEIEKLNAETESNIIIESEEEMKKSLELIVNPPEEYEKAYDLVIEAYGHYVNLYNLSKNPKGNYEMFVENYTSSQNEVETTIKKITTMYKYIYIGTNNLTKTK